jgi:hypothetical protein
MRHARHLAWQRVGGEIIVVDLGARRALGLNPVGSLVWELIGRSDEEALARTVAERFAVPLERAADDVRAFLADLRTRGLVEDRA